MYPEGARDICSAGVGASGCWCWLDIYAVFIVKVRQYAMAPSPFLSPFDEGKLSDVFAAAPGNLCLDLC